MSVSEGGRFELRTDAAVFVDGCFYLSKAGAAIELASKRVEIFYFYPE